MPRRFVSGKPIFRGRVPMRMILFVFCIVLWLFVSWFMYLEWNADAPWTERLDEPRKEEPEQDYERRIGIRTLVVVMGQLRATSLTWERFERHVLDSMSADMFLCAEPGTGDPRQDPYYIRAARDTRAVLYNITRSEMLAGLDEAASVLGVEPSQLEDVRGVKDNWLGGLPEANGTERGGSGLLLSYNRWICLQHGRDLWDRYDRFIITRPDTYWVYPHVPTSMLPAEFAWTPEGEEHGGINDRHMVCSDRNVRICLSPLEAVLRGREFRSYFDGLGTDAWMNHEVFLSTFLDWKSVPRRRIPNLSFLVATAADETRWSTGHVALGDGMFAKYPTEMELAEARLSELKSGSESLVKLLANVATGTCTPPCMTP